MFGLKVKGYVRCVCVCYWGLSMFVRCVSGLCIHAQSNAAISKLITQHNLVIMPLSIWPCSCYRETYKSLITSISLKKLFEQALRVSLRASHSRWSFGGWWLHFVVSYCWRDAFYVQIGYWFLHSKHFHCTHHECLFL